MKDSILDVLLYLFEHYLADDAGLFHDRQSLRGGPIYQELISTGFSPAEIARAVDWLDGLAERRLGTAPRAPLAPVRVYAEAELDRLDVECRGFLLVLEQCGVLDAELRELVLDRAFALELDELDVDELKWVVLLVLFDQPGREAACAWIEAQVLADVSEPVH
jgi:Smg protein